MAFAAGKQKSNRSSADSYLLKEIQAARSGAEGRSGHKVMPRLGFTCMQPGRDIDMVAGALLSALQKRRMRTRVFFARLRRADGFFYEELTQRPTYVLDPWLLDHRSILYLLGKHADTVDLTLMVGEAGLFDTPLGAKSVKLDGRTYVAHCSQDQLARRTGTPHILVLDASNFDVTRYAQIKGIIDYASPSVISGFLLNRVSPEHYKKLRHELTQRFDLPVLGYLPNGPVFGTLTTSTAEDRAELGKLAERFFDIDGIIALANEAEPLEWVFPKRLMSLFREQNARCGNCRIAYPNDPMFRNRTQDNLDLMEELGVDLVPVSLHREGGLPEGLNGFYISGGTSEVRPEGEDLGGSRKFRETFKAAVQSGMRVLAEGEGYRFLTRGVYDVRGKFLPMSAARDLTLDDSADSLRPAMTYGRLISHEPNLISDRNHAINAAMLPGPGREYDGDLRFDHSGGARWRHGIAGEQVYATPLRFHFLSQPECLRAFLDACRDYRPRGRNALYGRKYPDTRKFLRDGNRSSKPFSVVD